MIHDSVQLQIFNNLFRSVAEEMGVVMQRSAYSPNIKERLDFSCALFDRDGGMVAQAAHIPVHLGAMPLSVRAAIESFDLDEGDVVLLNDPFSGGSHLPDITAITPAFHNGTLIGYLANRAHHADVGGTFPGSMGVGEDVYQEGVRIPPVRIYRRGLLQEDVMNLLLANVRVPVERRGDLQAQLAANRRGLERLVEIVQKYGIDTTQRWMKRLQDYSRQMMQTAIATIPAGEYTFEDVLEGDGIISDPIPIRVRITITSEIGSKDEDAQKGIGSPPSATIDFSGSAPQVKGPFNCVYAVTLSAVGYVFRCLLDEAVPTNSGIFQAIKVIAPSGTVVNARPPAAVAAGNVETSQRIVDVVLGALARAIPERIPAAGCGTMNNVTIGGINPVSGTAFTYYETLGGGMGAHRHGPGLSAVQTHMTNTKNTPVEALEHAYPLRVKRYALRRGSGGLGQHRGGDGLIREMEALVPCRVALLTERRQTRPYGAAGGEAGVSGENSVIRHDGRLEFLPGKVEVSLSPGDTLRIATPGGGGYGPVPDHSPMPPDTPGSSARKPKDGEVRHD